MLPILQPQQILNFNFTKLKYMLLLNLKLITININKTSFDNSKDKALLYGESAE